MFLRETTQKRRDGTPVKHYQIAESVWNREKKRSEPRIVHSFGRVDDPTAVEELRKLARSILRRISPEDLLTELPGWKLIDAWTYGDVWALEQLWRRLGISSAITNRCRGRKTSYAIERALFAMVANRAVAPSSKLYCYEQWLAEDTRIEGAADLDLHHLYRAMDFLEANREEIEQEVFFSVANLFNLDVDLIFYDTTSLHFEIDEDDRGMGEDNLVLGSVPAGRKKYKAPRRRGNAKNGRGDVPQIVVGLAVTRDGMPVRHWVLPGNTVDVTTVDQVKKDLRGWRLSRCVFVGDAGMVSAENLRKLSLGGGKYILCMPISPGNEVAKHVITRPGRYQEVAQNLRVKEVWVGDGERRRRYVVCHNPDEVVRQRRHRARVLEALEAELASLRQVRGEEHSKRACALVSSRRFGRYIRKTKAGKLAIDMSAVRQAEKRDGKFVVHSNDDTLTAEDLALGYKQLMEVERAWRRLKSGLKMRPVYHWAPHRIHAHVALTVLALTLQRAAEIDCADTWRNIRDDLKQVKLAQLEGPHGTVFQTTELTPQAAKRLKDLQIDKPPEIVAWA